MSTDVLDAKLDTKLDTTTSTSAAPAPTISVLVPIYNVERYLDECLDSLKVQTFRDFEVLCINDGSTDGSHEIIQRYCDADKRFRCIDKPNSGYGASMNRGLREARGTWIAILESDDMFVPEALQLLYAKAQQFDFAVDVVKANFSLYWSTPEPHTEFFDVVGDLPYRTENRPLYCPDEGQEIFYAKPSIWSCLYKRSFLQQKEITFLETPGASYQDASFTFKVFAASRASAFIGESILLYRQDNENSSVNSPGKVFCVCDEYQEMKRWLAQQPELHKRLAQSLAIMQVNSYLWNYNRLAPVLREEFFPTMHQQIKKDFDAGLFSPNDVGMFRYEQTRVLVQNPRRFKKVWSNGEPQYDNLSKVIHLFKLGGIGLALKLVISKLKDALCHKFR